MDMFARVHRTLVIKQLEREQLMQVQAHEKYKCSRFLSRSGMADLLKRSIQPIQCPDAEVSQWKKQHLEHKPYRESPTDKGLIYHHEWDWTMWNLDFQPEGDGKNKGAATKVVDLEIS